MSKSRINKFIFQDGQIFLRLKTMAKNLKVKKTEANYYLEFSTPNTSGNLSQVPVVWIESFRFSTENLPEIIKSDALEMGYSVDNQTSITEALPKEALILELENWGTRLSLKNPDKSSTSYYITPKSQNYGVKIGPIPQSIDKELLEIDWENLQWGKL